MGGKRLFKAGPNRFDETTRQPAAEFLTTLGRDAQQQAVIAGNK
jgi:hypothetical protein